MTNLIDRNDKSVKVHNKCSKIPTPTSHVLGYSCANIRFEQLDLSSKLELITGTYELPFLTTTNTCTITSHNIEIPLESSCTGVLISP